jgi:hypothetical protein
VRPTVPDVAPLVRAYYAKPGNDMGGSLHIVLEDENVADHHVAACIQFARERGDEDGMWLARVLLTMSRTQRLRLAAR